MEHRHHPPASAVEPETGPAGWREVARRRVRRTTVAAGALGVALTGLLGGLAAAGHTTFHTATSGTSASPSTGTGSSGTGSSTSSGTGSTSPSSGSAAPTISGGAGVTSGAS